jgi:hypothetical protein
METNLLNSDKNYIIVEKCDAYNAKAHFERGAKVLKREGATPVKWVHDDNFGHFYTLAEAQKVLLSYARKYYNEHGSAQEYSSVKEIENEYKELGISSCNAKKWFKGPGFYENEEAVFLYNATCYEEDVVTYSIEEVDE